MAKYNDKWCQGAMVHKSPIDQYNENPNWTKLTKCTVGLSVA